MKLDVMLGILFSLALAGGIITRQDRHLWQPLVTADPDNDKIWKYVDLFAESKAVRREPTETTPYQKMKFAQAESPSETPNEAVYKTYSLLDGDKLVTHYMAVVLHNEHDAWLHLRGIHPHGSTLILKVPTKLGYSHARHLGPRETRKVQIPVCDEVRHIIFRQSQRKSIPDFQDNKANPFKIYWMGYSKQPDGSSSSS
ncbi:hypothetical protein PCANC_05990 [Puccinia coronata f. sp. avenae]|uniref:Uncharacterized protein n=1 Tax=Puccinia coronata f. sp. avenae TaxID=200324 RepID=A0A2N5VU55_9BASI|nr:hypothetical protein PCANC_05990 [Puccinia coronata f. sp. avenae]